MAAAILVRERFAELRTLEPEKAKRCGSHCSVREWPVGTHTLWRDEFQQALRPMFYAWVVVRNSFSLLARQKCCKVWSLLAVRRRRRDGVLGFGRRARVVRARAGLPHAGRGGGGVVGVGLWVPMWRGRLGGGGGCRRRGVSLCL